MHKPLVAYTILLAGDGTQTDLAFTGSDDLLLVEQRYYIRWKPVRISDDDDYAVLYREASPVVV
jgi:hypothetical protein